MANEWRSIGIPSESRFVELYYEPASAQFLAHFYRGLGKGYGVKSLYARHFTDETYRKITPEDESLTYEEVVLCRDLSKIYVNVFTVRKRGKKFLGYEWHSVQEIDTDTGEVSVLLSADDLQVEEPYVKGWISRLRRVKGNGSEIICTIAFKRKREKQGTAIEYYICKIFPQSGEYQRITKMAQETPGE